MLIPTFLSKFPTTAATDNKMNSLNSDSEEQSDNKEVEDESKKGEKRTRNVQEQEVKKTKMLRNFWKTLYLELKIQKTFSACGKKCRQLQHKKINGTIRKETLRIYWEFADVVRQREFIIEHCENIK